MKRWVTPAVFGAMLTTIAIVIVGLLLRRESDATQTETFLTTVLAIVIPTFIISGSTNRKATETTKRTDEIHSNTNGRLTDMFEKLEARLIVEINDVSEIIRNNLRDEIRSGKICVGNIQQDEDD